MTNLIIGALCCALAAMVFALCREIRIRKALETLLQLILSRWRTNVLKTMFKVIPIITLLLLIGCNDERVVAISREAADRQAQQNQLISDLNKELAAGSRELVAADAKAREKMVDVHRELQSERQRLDTGWTSLEHQRQQVASRRRTESLLAPAIQNFGVAVVVALVLGFSWYALVASRNATVSDAELSNMLIEEILSNQPTTLQPTLSNDHCNQPPQSLLPKGD